MILEAKSITSYLFPLNGCAPIAASLEKVLSHKHVLSDGVKWHTAASTKNFPGPNPPKLGNLLKLRL
jgi:hypothetical protein